VSLEEKTKKLIFFMNKLRKIFENDGEPQDMNDHKFFAIVKKETTPIFSLLQEWESDATFFVSNNDSKVFFPQIIATKENIEVLILHSYYKDLRKRLYMERYNSVLYVLENLLSEIIRLKGEERK